MGVNMAEGDGGGGGGGGGGDSGHSSVRLAYQRRLVGSFSLRVTGLEVAVDMRRSTALIVTLQTLEVLSIDRPPLRLLITNA